MNEKDYKKKILLWKIYIALATIISLIVSYFLIPHVRQNLIQKYSYDSELLWVIWILFLAWYASLISIVIGFWFIYLDFWKKKYNFYLTDESILNQDIKEILSISQKLYNDIKIDRNETGINLELLNTIEKWIQKIEQKVQYLDNKFYALAKMKLIEIHNNEDEKENLKKSKTLLKKFYNDWKSIKKVNYYLIKQWLENHSEELNNIKDDIGNLKIEIKNNTWKLALEAQKIRLQTYIESINNLVK
jgi:ABC-type multidrug transport system fused ATPase/permease subunit